MSSRTEHADQLFLAVRESVKGGFRASQGAGDVIDGQVCEAFGEEQIEQCVEEFATASGRETPSGQLLHEINSTEGRLAVLSAVQYFGQ